MGTLDRKNREKLVRRNEILDAAVKMFLVKGFEYTTMDDIAKEAEFTKKTIYSYFNSKEVLYYEIILRGFKSYNTMSEEVMSKETHTNESEKIMMLGKAAIDFHFKYPGYFKAMLDYGNKTRGVSSNVDNLLIDQLNLASQHSFDILHDSIVKGIEKGEFSDKSNPETLCFTLTSFILGLAELIGKEESHITACYSKNIPELVEESFKFIINSIKK